MKIKTKSPDMSTHTYITYHFTSENKSQMINSFCCIDGLQFNEIFFLITEAVSKFAFYDQSKKKKDTIIR